MAAGLSLLPTWRRRGSGKAECQSRGSLARSTCGLFVSAILLCQPALTGGIQCTYVSCPRRQERPQESGGAADEDGHKAPPGNRPASSYVCDASTAVASLPAVANYEHGRDGRHDRVDAVGYGGQRREKSRQQSCSQRRIVPAQDFSFSTLSPDPRPLTLGRRREWESPLRRRHLCRTGCQVPCRCGIVRRESTANGRNEALTCRCTKVQDPRSRQRRSQRRARRSQRPCRRRTGSG